jgi:GT2 family glycosyltransferase
MGLDAPRISVIIPSYNQAESLVQTLQALERQSIRKESFEVILIDDGSKDRTEAMVRGLDFSFPLIFSRQENRGAAAARNKGVEYAKSNLLLFLDADMLAEPDLLKAHIEHHEIDNNRLILEGVRKPWRTAESPLFYQILDLDTNTPVGGTDKVFWGEMLSCNLSLRNDLFFEIGGFDEKLLRWEDVDFDYRAYKKNVTFRYAPDAVAFHNHPISFRDYCQKQRYLHRIANELFDKFPEIPGNLPYLRDRGKIDFANDPITLSVRKIFRQFMATPAILYLLESYILQGFEKYWPNRRLLGLIYKTIIASYQWIGLRENNDIKVHKLLDPKAYF